MIDHGLLRHVPIFETLAPGALQVLAAGTSERRFAAERVIFSAGDRPEGLLVIASGRVRIVRSRDGRQHLVHEEGPGGTLGDIPVFSGGTYPATAIAAEPTTCLVVPTETIRATMQSDPGLAFTLLQRLALRTRGLVERVDRLAAQDVKGRLAAAVLARHDGGAPEAEIILGPQSELAEELGTVREVLVRALRDLRVQGLIEAVPSRRGRYRVRDADALRRMAE